jgi:Protein of unknown function (DUF2844)
MASIRHLLSGNWQVQIQRKGRAAVDIFLCKEIARSMQIDWSLFLLALAMIAALLCSAGSAQAALGGGIGTVEADGAHFSAPVVSTTYGTYSTYVLTLPNGGTIDEYAAGGVVFGLSWRTPGRPDLVQLLGSHFASFQAGFSPRTRGVRRAPPTIEKSDFVVHSRGHPGAFHGQALLPALAPSGFSLSDLK